MVIIRNSSSDNTLKPHICTVCYKSYRYLASLQRHQKYECGKEKAFNCNYCSHKSHRKDNLRVHMLEQHKVLIPTKQYNRRRDGGEFQLIADYPGNLPL